MNGIVLALCFTGAVVAFRQCESTSPFGPSELDRLFVSATLAFLLLGATALASVRLGIFSATLVSVLTLVLSAAAFGASLAIKSKADRNTGNAIPAALVLGGLGVLCLLLYAWYPTYYLLGWRDHGLYLIFAHHISYTGGLDLDLPWLADIHERVGDAVLLGYPGIYSAYNRGLSDSPSTLIPQFMHLFPAYGALSHQVAGLEGVVRTNAVIAFFALWSFFMVSRRIVGDRWGLAATFLLAINASMVWVTRSTFTEPLQIVVLFTGVYLLLKATDRESAWWALLAGVVLGLGVFNRLDALIAVLVIVGFALYACIKRPELKKAGLCLVGSYLGISTLGLVDGYLHAYPYLFDLWAHGSLKQLVIANYVFGFGAGIALIVRGNDRWRGTLARYLDKALPLVLSGIVGWVVIRYGLSFSNDADFPLRSVRELGWYVTPLALVLSVVGVWVLYRERQWLYILTIGGVFLATLFVYTWRPSITPDHFWASRRWLSYCIPLIVLFSVKAVQFGHQTLVNRGYPISVSGVVILAPLAWYLWGTMTLVTPFWSTSLLAAYPYEYERLATELERNDSAKVYATRDGHLAGVLTYVYGIPTVLVRSNGFEVFREELGDQAWAIGGARQVISPQRISLGSGPKWCGEYTESVRGGRPEKLISRCHYVSVEPLSHAGTAVCDSDSIAVGDPLLHTRVGKLDQKGRTLTSIGQPGFLQFGPYVSATPGKYRVTWYGSMLESVTADIGEVDVVADKGGTMIAQRLVQVTDPESDNGSLVHLDFNVLAEVRDLEFRFRIAEAIVELTHIQVECIE